MTTNKSNRNARTLSTLSVAAIALLAAAAPGFAQTSSNEPNKENPTGTELALASSKSSLPTAESIVATGAKESSRVAEAPKVKKLTAASFNVSSQFSAIDATQIFSQQLKLAVTPFSATKVSESAGTDSRKRIEFVPSKGQTQPE